MEIQKELCKYWVDKDPKPEIAIEMEKGVGQVHLMDHSLGGIAISRNKTLDLIVPGILITRVLLNNYVYLDYRNHNHGQCGKAIGADLLTNPDLVATDPVISFKTALWFWMTPQSPKPSCHDVITRRWNPSGADKSAGPGYGVTTNIINGGLECGKGWNAKVEDGIGFYKRYCDLLGVGYGNNQKPFGSDLNVIQLVGWRHYYCDTKSCDG
ncbi:hypothetical protein GBA52_007657 [Prunus armeniaca]|nr:hypothetical protein GBA52_007657 [Prunus armeniaca]